MGIYTLCVFLAGVLYACKPDANDISYTITSDTLDIIPSFSGCGFYESEHDSVYFYCKPKSCDSLCLYALTDSGWTLCDILKIPEVYADTVDTDYDVRRWELVNKDTVIAYVDFRHFSFLDIKNGSVIKSIPVIADTAYDVRCFNHMQWNHRRQSMGLMYFNSQTIPVKYNGDMEMMAEYSLKHGTCVFPFKYPYEITDTYLVTFSCEPFVVFYGDTMVVAFQTSPMMLCYDIKNNKTDSLYIKNKYYKALPKIDTTKINKVSAPNYMYEVLLTNFYYTTLIYDHHKEMYYRFFAKDLPLKDREGLLTTWDDKEYGLTLIDKNFNVVGDVIFNHKDYKVVYYPTYKGLYHAEQYKGKTILSLLNFDYQ